MTDFAVFDVSKWPVVYLKLSGIPEDLIEFEDYLKGFDLLYGKIRKFSLIIDSTDIGKISSYYLTRQAFHMNSNEDNTKKYVEKVGLVITSAYIKKLLNGFLQIKKPLCETKIFKDIDDCQQWIKNENSISNNKK